jgi:hypothetical protein
MIAGITSARSLRYQRRDGDLSPPHQHEACIVLTATATGASKCVDVTAEAPAQPFAQSSHHSPLCLRCSTPHGDHWGHLFQQVLKLETNVGVRFHEPCSTITHALPAVEEPAVAWRSRTAAEPAAAHSLLVHYSSALQHAMHLDHAGSASCCPPSQHQSPPLTETAHLCTRARCCSRTHQRLLHRLASHDGNLQAATSLWCSISPQTVAWTLVRC